MGKARNISVSLLFANLIAYRAGSFARGLAGSLAFAATAGFQGLLHGWFVDRLDVFHHLALLSKNRIFYTV